MREEFLVRQRMLFYLGFQERADNWGYEKQNKNPTVSAK